MSLVTDELLDERFAQESGIGSFLKSLLIVLSVILVGIYVGEMLFGKTSLETLLSLQEDEQFLQNEIYKLKQENASLQKDYFEFKSLMPNREE